MIIHCKQNLVYANDENIFTVKISRSIVLYMSFTANKAEMSTAYFYVSRSMCAYPWSKNCTISSNSTLLLHINQPAYFMERNMENIYISRTTQRTNTGQISACSQELEDSIDVNVVESSTCLKTIR